MKVLNKKCFACKDSINIFADNLENILFYDGRFYHEECFKKMNQVKKKCCKCKKDIVYGNGEAVLYDNHYYHKDCFIKWCGETKRKSQKREFARQNIDTYINNAENEMSKLHNSKTKQDVSVMKDNARKEIDRIKMEHKFNSYIRDVYNLPSISTNLWTRFNQVFTGRYKNMETPISVYELYDMWTSQQNKKLSKAHKRSITMGKEITGEARVLYDLAIIVSMYPSYLNHLEKKKMLEAKEKEKAMVNLVSLAKNNFVSNQKNERKVIEDIDDIL